MRHQVGGIQSSEDHPRSTGPFPASTRWPPGDSGSPAHVRRRQAAYDGHGPVGADLSPRSEATRVSVKSGRGGELAFVTVRHELVVDGTSVAVEEQDLVHRSELNAPAPRRASGRTAGAGEPAGPSRLELPTNPVLLLRFGALTYNAHRIHHDREYAARGGYPDLVVHGPLLALLALELPRIHAPGQRVLAFDYRLVRPAFAPSRIVCAGRPGGSGVEGRSRGHRRSALADCGDHVQLSVSVRAPASRFRLVNG
jgi:3-methylfumaryl-CoA hydratase